MKIEPIMKFEDVVTVGDYMKAIRQQRKLSKYALVSLYGVQPAVLTDVENEPRRTGKKTSMQRYMSLGSFANFVKIYKMTNEEIRVVLNMVNKVNEELKNERLKLSELDVCNTVNTIGANDG